MLVFLAVPAHAVTLTVGSDSGDETSTLNIPITVDDPEGIAGASFTLVYSNSLSVSLSSTFFDAFVNQFQVCGLTPEEIAVIEIPAGYIQPMITNESVSGSQTKMLIAAARCMPATASEDGTLFTASVSLKSGEPAGEYTLQIIPTTLHNTDAGYDAAGETIDLLIGSDLSKPLTSAEAFPVILNDEGYESHVAAGLVDFGDEVTAEDPDHDWDGDGYTENQGDMDDQNSYVYPGCEDVDDDGDGYSENEGDCDDTDASIHPGAVEILDDGIDNNCDGIVDAVALNVFYDEYYLAGNLDVAHAVANGWFLSGWEHYIGNGVNENRPYDMPAGYGDFNEKYYLINNPDVANAVIGGQFLSGWEHYSLWGKNEGRSDAKPVGYGDFNEEYYLAGNLDVAHALDNGWFMSGWQHYDAFGRYEARSYLMPSGYADFNETYYLMNNPDVANAVIGGQFLSGWEHYSLCGKNEGRKDDKPAGYGDFNEEFYLINNPDVAQALANGWFMSGWQHYDSFGRNEGRSYAQPSYTDLVYGGISP